MTEIEVLVERLAHSAGLPLPSYSTAGASGLDLLAAVDGDIEIPAGGTALIPTGLKIAVPAGYEAQIRARSGLALKHGIFVLNSPGTVDADYRGEVKVILGNFGDAAFTVQRGMRIAQMVIQAVPRARLAPVDELPASARGTGGFGSSGTGTRLKAED